MNASEAQWILERRARELASQPVSPDAAADRDALVFSLAQARYALELRYLKQVFTLRDLALLPGARAPLVGVTAWRGELIRVLDLTRILELPEGGPTDRNNVLVLGNRADSFALLADTVLHIAEVPDSIGRLNDSRFVRGVTADAVAVLDGAELIRTFTEEEP